MVAVILNRPFPTVLVMLKLRKRLVMRLLSIIATVVFGAALLSSSEITSLPPWIFQLTKWLHQLPFFVDESKEKIFTEFTQSPFMCWLM